MRRSLRYTAGSAQENCICCYTEHALVRAGDGRGGEGVLTLSIPGGMKMQRNALTLGGQMVSRFRKMCTTERSSVLATNEAKAAPESDPV